jgi:hypothetical protein
MPSRSSSFGAASEGDEERGQLLLPSGRHGARALTCGREDGDGCGYADGADGEDPQRAKSVHRLRIAMALCATFMMVRGRAA